MDRTVEIQKHIFIECSRSNKYNIKVLNAVEHMDGSYLIKKVEKMMKRGIGND